MLATYEDGTTRTLTKGFTVEPGGALQDEKEVHFVYNTARVVQAIQLVKGTFAGEGTKESPYLIETAEDLTNMSLLSQTGETFKGKYFEFIANITLPKDWKPIGVTLNGTIDIEKGKNLAAFGGTIDGKNYTITVPEGGLPLLGYAQDAEVRNLNIYGKKIAGYGLVNHLEGVGLSGTSIVIDNVTLKRGSATLKSGLLGANVTTNPFAGCSAGFAATVRNCTIEKGVTIGYDKDQSMIGSIAGRMQGTVENCVSYADVYGVSYVGGIVGTRDNAIGACPITNCTFSGSVNASGNNAGGIAGGGYSNSSAPNGDRIDIKSCTVDGTVSGAENVGGILGSDSFVAQVWGTCSLVGNRFTGTADGTKNVGGIIGFYGSLNKFDNVAANFYSTDCGTDKGIGAVKYVDTNYAAPTPSEDTVYFNTEKGTSGCPAVNVDGKPLTIERMIPWARIENP